MESVDFVDEESARRIEELRKPFELAHAYARVERATLMPDGKQETDGALPSLRLVTQQNITLNSILTKYSFTVSCTMLTSFLKVIYPQLAQQKKA
jgi:hypothetical protein